MLQANCSADLANIGAFGCSIGNPFTDVVALILTKSSFYFATKEDFGNQTKWNDGIRSGNIFPLNNVVEYDDQSEESQYYTSPTGIRVPRRPGNYRHTYRFNKGLEQHKALQTFKMANLNVFIVDSAGNIQGYTPDGTKVSGFTVGMFNPEKMTQAKIDGTPAFTPVALDMNNPEEWNEKGVSMKPGWFARSLVPVSDVEIKVVSATAALVVLKVAYYNGIGSDGTDDLIGISGILQDDFVFTSTAPTAAAMVDNGDGTYNFPGVGMVSGSVTLVAPSAATSVGDPIAAVAPANIAIA